MTHEQIIHLKKTITTASAYYGRQLPDAAVAMYADDMADMPFEQVMEAIRLYRRNTANRGMFIPADIRDIVTPTGKPEDFAREAASRVIGAVSRFGSYAPHEARAWIGELGWRAVERTGGWLYMCENLGTNKLPLTTAQAQIRDACLATLRLGNMGIIDVPIQLPDRRTQGLQPAADIIGALLNPAQESETK